MNPKHFWLAVAVLGLGIASAQNLEANKNVVRQFQAAVSAQNLAVFDTLVSPNIIDRNPSPGQKQGLEGFKESFKPFFAAFPDLKVGIDAVFIAEGDKVTVRHYFTGTHNGPFGDIKATGRKVSAMALDTWRVRDGKLVEVWHFEELLQLVGQLTAPQPLNIPPGTATLPSGPGNAEFNKALGKRFYDVFNARRFEDYNGFVVADFFDRNPLPGQKPGLVGLKEALQGFPVVFPDIQITIEEMVTEGDLVAVRGIAKGTHKAEFLGVPATGKQVVFGFIDLYRIRDGKIVETWHIEELLQTLGFLSAK